MQYVTGAVLMCLWLQMWPEILALHLFNGFLILGEVIWVHWLYVFHKGAARLHPGGHPAPLQAFLRKQCIAALRASFLPPSLLSAVPMKNVSLNFRIDSGFEQQGHHRGILPMLL